MELVTFYDFSKVHFYEKGGNIMALINCPECNKEISDSVSTCPHCGFRIKEDTTMHENTYVVPKKKKNLIPIVVIGLVVVAAIVVCVVLFMNSSKKNKILEDAQFAYEHENYVEAERLLLEIKGYKNADDLYNEVVEAEKNEKIYKSALDAMGEYDYKKATELLQSIPSYRDVQDLIKQSENGEFLELCAKYIFDFIKDGGFFNPSAVRVLQAGYSEYDYYAKLLGADGIIYLTIQGTNRIGGTINKDHCILVGGEKDGKAYLNEDDDNKSLNDYSSCEKTIDTATINKMLQKYWSDMGITN